MPNSEGKDLATELEVISGNPTSKELAALVAVLRENATSMTKTEQAEPNWAKGSQVLRDGNNTGGLEWRSDFKGEI
jgi:hypothetical protein